jgi:hypothetical protein
MRSSILDLRPGRSVELNERPFTVEKIDNLGDVLLKCSIRGHVVKLSTSEAGEMHLKGTLKCSGAAVAKGPPLRPPAPFPGKLLSNEQRVRVTRRISYSNAVKHMYPVGPKNIGFQMLIQGVAARIGDKTPPSPHTVYRWLTRYIESGYDAAVFVQDAGAVRTRKPRVRNDVKDTLEKHIQELLGESVGATLRGVSNKALARTAQELGFPSFVSIEGEEFLTAEFLNHGAPGH